jgi:ankyrin repeat protein
MKGDAATVRALLKQGSDVNAAQGDGMTALHWAAIKNDAALAQVLLYAGANVRATTRINGYTPLFLASQYGYAEVMATLLDAGSDPKATSTTGSTPLMLAAASGNVAAVKLLLDAGADVNARDTARQQTAVMFAAAYDRAPVITLLVERGADLTLASKVQNLYQFSAEDSEGRPQPAPGTTPEPSARPARAAAPAPKPRVAGVDRGFVYTELIGYQGGLTPLLLAAREGHAQSVKALLDAGADINQVSPGDKTGPLLIAIINGQYDLAKDLLDRGADPKLSADNGVTPLYAVLNVQWAPKALYPQPRAYLQQKLTYLDLMKMLLDKGVDVNARLKKKVWYSGYNFDLSGVDEIGATPFWRAAYASDVDAMRLLIAHGADPNIPTSKPAGRPRTGDGVGYGEGFAANSHRNAPSGWMPAVKYLVEELGADVNARDHEGNTALHHAAARGDNEMILYLVSKGADVKAVNRAGETTVDMANGPVQRIQPFPETIALLEKLGAKNNHRCKSC